MRDDLGHAAAVYSVVIVTLDAHVAGPAERILPRLEADFPGLRVSIHAAAEWGGHPDALARAREAVDGADMVIATLLFLEEHVQAILPNLRAARAATPSSAWSPIRRSCG